MAFVSSEMISLRDSGEVATSIPMALPLVDQRACLRAYQGAHLQHLATRDTVISWTCRTFKPAVTHDSPAPDVSPVVFRAAPGRAGQGCG